MLVKKEQRKKKQIAKNSFLWEYKPDSENLGFALAEINGRYPDSGKVVNKVCQEIYYVIGGNGRIFVDNKEIELKEGDAFLIESGKKYHVVGENLLITVSSSPAWYPEQYEFSKE